MAERRFAATRAAARASRQVAACSCGGWRLASLAFLLCAVLAVLAGCGEAPETATRPATPGPTGIRYLAADDSGTAGYALALEPRPFRFPADHAPHSDFRTEWWYFTGNVHDAAGRHYGFELTVFRIALAADAPVRASALAASQIWMGNLAVTDTRRERFQAAERLSRGADGLAGATTEGGEVTIALEDWSIDLAGDRVVLHAMDDGFGVDLELTGLEHIVAQGDNGLDAKGPEPGNASYYFSVPRLAVTGELQSDGKQPVAVEGTAWMDREWSTSALSADVAGWDWFALELDDGRDLMFYRLRNQDGGTSPFSGGSLVDAGGTVTRLTADAVELSASREWTSPGTNVRYPIAWQMTIPSQALELAIEPRIDDQELDLTVRYWEGAVAVTGRSGGRPVSGVGYLELAGY